MNFESLLLIIAVTIFQILNVEIVSLRKAVSVYGQRHYIISKVVILWKEIEEGWTKNHKTRKTQSIRKWIIVFRLIVIRILAFAFPSRLPSETLWSVNRFCSVSHSVLHVEICIIFYFPSFEKRKKKVAENKFKWSILYANQLDLSFLSGLAENAALRNWGYEWKKFVECSLKGRQMI